MITPKPRIPLVEDTRDRSPWLVAALRQDGTELHFATDGRQADRCLQAGHGFDAQQLARTKHATAALHVLLESPRRTVGKAPLHAAGRFGAPSGVLISNFRGMGYLLTLPAAHGR